MMRILGVAVIAGALASFHPIEVYAGIYCTAPRAPEMYETKPEPPREPYCVNKIMNTHTCSDWEIDRYNDDVRDYNRDLKSYELAAQLYISELNDYLAKARRYAECELSYL